MFAELAEVMPNDSWVPDLAGMNRGIPLRWFHAARSALDRAEPAGTNEFEGPA